MILILDRSMVLLAMVTSLWLAFYIVARGSTNRLTFRVFVVLTAVSFYYANVYLDTYALFPERGPYRSMGVMLGLAAGQNLSFYLLPENIKKKNQWIARWFVAFGIISVVALLGGLQASHGSIANNAYDRLPNLYKLLATCGIIYNIWLIYREGYLAQNRSFYIALIFGSSTILYGALGEAAKATINPALEFPRFVSTILFFSFLGLMGYSVARHQALLEQRVGPRDFILSALLTAVIAGIYLIPGSLIGLSPLVFILLAFLVISTHAAVDLLRETLNRKFHEGERGFRKEIDQLGTASGDEKDFRSNLRRGLAVVCHNLQATSGFIAVRSADEFTIQASLRSYPVNTKLPTFLKELQELTDQTGTLNKTKWLAPAFDGQTLVAVIGMGPRRGLKGYLENDLFWLEDLADSIGNMVGNHLGQIRKTNTSVRQPGSSLEQPSAKSSSFETYLPKFSLDPDRQWIKQVEFGLKNLNDYITLGRSPLAEQVGVEGETHIDRGRTLHQTLVNLVNTLRPSGERPGEPLPRAWHSFAILHDAYVEDIPDREIMARLYVSETTYYRTRRKAVRGLTRALLESGIVQ